MVPVPVSVKGLVLGVLGVLEVVLGVVLGVLGVVLVTVLWT